MPNDSEVAKKVIGFLEHNAFYAFFLMKIPRKINAGVTHFVLWEVPQ